METYSWEKTFMWEEEPVLTCRLALPQGTGCRKIDSYYRHLTRILQSRWRRESRRQQQRLQQARLKSRPFVPRKEVVNFTVSLESKERLSLYWERAVQQENACYRERFGDNWALPGGWPLSLREVLPACHSRGPLVREAIRQAEKRQEQGVSVYYRDFSKQMRSTFSRRRFYLTEEGVNIFYPLSIVAPKAEGIPTFLVKADRSGDE